MIETEQQEMNALMARLAEGDRAAFTPVFRMLWPRVHRLCLQLLHSNADADDAAQQAMERILSRASEYDPDRAALPWALGIAGWECRSLRRRQFRRREHLDDTSPEPQDGKPGADDALATRDLVRAAMAALGTLTAADQETLLATYLENGAPPSVGGATLRKRRERALTRLRAAFRRLYAID
ncbi:MAG TPA: sigma factor [Polyangiaceae bacterium]